MRSEEERQQDNDAIFPILDAFEASGWERRLVSVEAGGDRRVAAYSTRELADVLERLASSLRQGPFSWDISGKDWARDASRRAETDDRRRHIASTWETLSYGWITFFDGLPSDRYDPELAAEGRARGYGRADPP
jgi:hypothetical protein